MIAQMFDRLISTATRSGCTGGAPGLRGSGMPCMRDMTAVSFHAPFNETVRFALRRTVITGFSFGCQIVRISTSSFEIRKAHLAYVNRQ